MTKIKLICVFILFFTFSLMGCNVNDSNGSKETETSVMNSPTAVINEGEPELLAALPDCINPPPQYLSRCKKLREPTLKSPSDNSFLNNTTVTFKWKKPDNPNITKYTLYIINLDNDEETLYDVTNLTTTTINNLSRNIPYLWGVNAYDPDRNHYSDPWYQSGWSSSREFKIRPPQPSLSGSIDGGAPKLSFNKLAQYDVQIDRISDITPHSGTDTGFKVITSGSGSMSYTDYSHYVNLQLSQSIGADNAFYSIRYVNDRGWSSLPSNFVVYSEENDGGGGIGF